jgi:hypothetical protein
MDLDRQVAEALGQRVCGGGVRTTGGMGSGFVHTCEACGERLPLFSCNAPSRHLPPPPYSTSWEAAGRLCEEMRRRGYNCTLKLDGDGGLCWVEIWRGHDAEGYPIVRGWANSDTLTHALSLAALRALGERGEG